MIINKKWKIKQLITCFLCILSGIIVTVPYLSYAVTQDDIDEANRQHESYEQEQKNINAEITEITDKISEVGVKIAELDLQINQKQVEIDATKKEFQQLNEDKEKQYADMKLRIQFMYESSTYNSLDILLQSKNLSDLLSRTEYIQKLSKYDRDALEKLNQTIIAINNKQIILNEEMKSLNTLKASVEDEKNNLEVLLVSSRQNLNESVKNADEAESLAIKYEQELEAQKLEQQRLEEEQASREAAQNGNDSSVDTTPMNYTQRELEMLAAIIQCEAGNQEYFGKLAVGSVVINRVRSPRFANSIEGVIYSPGQFSPVASGRFEIVLLRGANEECTNAAKDVLNGKIVINAHYFHVYRPEKDTYGTIIGDHIFI